MAIQFLGGGNRDGKLQSNSTIHVVYRGGILETHPARFENAYKVRLMR